MAGGVKGPNSPLYTRDIPGTSPNDEASSSPVTDSQPQIPKTPNKAPKSILKERSAKKAAVAPQVNKKARETMALNNHQQSLVAQLQHLLTHKQFAEHKEALMHAINHPDSLPNDFTIVYIDENGQEVTVIPPESQLQQNPDRKSQLRNALKGRASELVEYFNDKSAEAINRAIINTTREFDECNALLQERGAAPHRGPETPDRLCLDKHFFAFPPASASPPTEDTFVLEQKPTVKELKKLRFDEEQFSEQWVKFYTDPTKKVPGQLHTLNDIRQFTDKELEDEHDYIQLLFPNRHISAVNPGAPGLTDELARTIRGTPALQKTILDSVDQMLEFWGLQRQGSTVTVNPGEAQRHSKWDGPFDHNHKRMTRMLDFLMECGQENLAMNIEKVVQQQRASKQQSVNTHWADAVGKQHRAPAPTSSADTIPERAHTPEVHHYSDYVDAFPYDECQNMERIEFSQQNKPVHVLTNFYQPQTPIEIDGELWRTTEHYYQACKFGKGSEQWHKIQSLPDTRAVYQYIYPNFPDTSSRIKAYFNASQWNARRNDVMLAALRAKARQVPEFRQALVNAGTKILFDVSPNDSYWGTGKNTRNRKTGKNVFGSMLMQIRDEINAGQL